MAAQFERPSNDAMVTLMVAIFMEALMGLILKLGKEVNRCGLISCERSEFLAEVFNLRLGHGYEYSLSKGAVIWASPPCLNYIYLVTQSIWKFECDRSGLFVHPRDTHVMYQKERAHSAFRLLTSSFALEGDGKTRKMRGSAMMNVNCSLVDAPSSADNNELKGLRKELWSLILFLRAYCSDVSIEFTPRNLEKYDHLKHVDVNIPEGQLDVKDDAQFTTIKSLILKHHVSSGFHVKVCAKFSTRDIGNYYVKYIMSMPTGSLLDRSHMEKSLCEKYGIK